MTRATACFDTDSSIAEESTNKFWSRNSQSEDSGKNDMDSDNDSWSSQESSESGGSISIHFHQDASTENVSAREFKASSRKSSNFFFFDTSSEHSVNTGSNSSSKPITLDIRRTSTTTNSSKRRQTKLLLVALIESFCAIYGDHPENNRRIFFLICQTLNSMGFVDREFVDEMASVRSSFQRAFQRLFWTALETIRSEEFQLAGGHRLITPTPWSEQQNPMDAIQTGSNENPSTSSFTPSTFQQMPNMGFDLSVDNSRYLSDFIELSLLGKGGFASAWRARNKLDDIEYAIKKVWLGSDIHEDGSNPYDKIFREIKSLARLEHKNVIRYYSSWLEWRSCRKASDMDSNHEEHDFNEDDEDEWTNHSDVSKKSAASVFEGIDPTFEDSGGYLPETSSNEVSAGIDFISDGDTSGTIDANKPVCPADSRPPVISILKLGKTEGRGGHHCTFDVPAEECPLTNHSSDSDNGHITQPFSPPNSQPAVTSIPIVRRERKNSSGRHGSIESLNKTIKEAPSFNGGWTLFIQMQLCPATLQDYIRHRNRYYTDTGCCIGPEDCRRNIEIFSQILEGVSYIHEKDLIHRDLKPGNIFLGLSSDRSSRRRKSQSYNPSPSKDDSSFSSIDSSSSEWLKRNLLEGDWVPKIGDFGLVATMTGAEGEALVSASTPLCESVSDVSSSFGGGSLGGGSLREMSCSASSNKSDSQGRRLSRPKYHRSRTSPVGTVTYASPEQLANPPLAYDQKVDIYSLGIIFFELYQPFATHMERAEHLRELKKGVLPDDFVKKFPKEAALILWMMAEDASQRPTAQQLMEFEMFAGPPDMYNSLHIQLQDKTKALDQKDTEVARLRAAMDAKQRECDEMQLKIQRMEEKLRRMEIHHGQLPDLDSTYHRSHHHHHQEEPLKGPNDSSTVQRFTHWKSGSPMSTSKDQRI
ncbi:hypothetical protein INT43_004591 [Umbelopsis isabellina]|uniref:non-specific serine/threonine protein kinase n=1 Tax=Mortierella isabellina TaxID=91625 RepID=A0A8H7PFX0_MORIS|nr:hypothetical protein INT43_004591 [Umbelopsis isabellina]